jgi:hypothetical protein
MVGKMFKPVLCLFVVALACSTVLAQSERGPLVAHTTHSGVITPTKEAPASLVKIFSNLGPTATNNYNDTTGYYVLGPTNSVGDGEQWIAVPFTPEANSTVTGLQMAIGLISGTAEVFVGLYSDNSGSVGTLMAGGPSTKIPAFGTCCELVSVKVSPQSVTAGTQYWIGVQTVDMHAPDFTGVAESSNEANTSYNPAKVGWFTFSNNWPAAAAFGTIP